MEVSRNYKYKRILRRKAAENGHLSVVKYLVENGVDIHADDDYALRWATKNGHYEVANYLKSLGSNLK